MALAFAACGQDETSPERPVRPHSSGMAEARRYALVLRWVAEETGRSEARVRPLRGGPNGERLGASWEPQLRRQIRSLTAGKPAVRFDGAPARSYELDLALSLFSRDADQATVRVTRFATRGPVDWVVQVARTADGWRIERATREAP